MASAKLCEVDGCSNPISRGGKCSKHYTRWYRSESPRATAGRLHEGVPRCAVDGCDDQKHAHSYCARHAYRFRAHGDPLGGRRGARSGEPLGWIAENASYAGDDCIKWPFEIGRYGYGTVKHDGKKRIASRVMCEAANGPAPSPEHDAAHSCGNGHNGCVNPRHLRWATRKENVADAKAAGTWNHGEKVPQSKLTRNDVLEIRSLAGSMMQQEIAEIYGVNATAISRIINRKRWAWLD